MIDKVGINRIQHGLVQPSAPKKASDGNAEIKADATLNVESAPLVEKAMQAEKVDRVAVEKARSMMLSGELDSPENIRGAADNILNFGL